MLFNHLDCADDAGIVAVKKDIASVETSVSKQQQQKKKYPAETKTVLGE